MPLNNDQRNALIDAVNQSSLETDLKSSLLELLNEKKRYGLVWEDKPEHAKERMKYELPVLVDVPERYVEGASPDSPHHVLIEGDNYNALTALQYTHAGKVDVIYIDPPYNTGNKDFSYHDKFHDEPEFIDREHRFRHSTWLSFMEKRLKLAKALLKETGVIFISIDDNEQAQLKLLCDEIFGEGNFVGMFPWRSRTAKADVPHGVSVDVEWVLTFSRPEYIAARTGERKYYKSDDYADRWRLQDLTKNTTSKERPNSFFTLISPKDGQKYPASTNRTWSITEDTLPKYLSLGKIVFPGDYDFLKIKRPAFRVFEQEDKTKAIEKFGSDEIQMSISTYLDDKTIGRTETGTKELRELFSEPPFGYPKPTTLIKYFINSCRNEDALILDFFAGSGTTLHATMALNAEDGGKRQCILVTNNENQICEQVTYERNKRVIQGYTNSKGQAVEGLKDNHLHYFKVDFVDREKTIRNQRTLISKLTDILRLKENAFASVHSDMDKVRIWKNDQKNILLVNDVTAISDTVQWIAQQVIPCKVYVFAPGAYPFTDDFLEVENKVELIAMPEAYRDAIDSALPTESLLSQGGAE